MDKSKEFDQLRSSAYSLQSFVKAENHRQRKNKQARIHKRESEEEQMIRAKKDTKIQPQHSLNVEIEGSFQESESTHWIVERNMILNSPTSYLIVPNTLITSECPMVPVANPTAWAITVHKGEVLGTVSKATDFFNRAGSTLSKEGMDNIASLIQQIIKADSDRNEIPTQAKNEAKEEGDVESEEEYRPRMAAMPDLEVYSLKDFWKWLDVGELPAELEKEAWAMLEKHEKAFRFYGHLGSHPTKAQIRTKDGVQPISLTS